MDGLRPPPRASASPDTRFKLELLDLYAKLNAVCDRMAPLAEDDPRRSELLAAADALLGACERWTERADARGWTAEPRFQGRRVVDVAFRRPPLQDSDSRTEWYEAEIGLAPPPEDGDTPAPSPTDPS